MAGARSVDMDGLLLQRWGHIRITSGAMQALFGFSVFLFSMLGILSRPNGELATIWPANAFMLGMMLRKPVLAKPLGWLCASIGFLVADGINRTMALDNLVMNACNLVSVGVAYLMLKSASRSGNDFGRPASFLQFVSAVVVGSLAAGLTSVLLSPAGAMEKLPQLVIYWTASELVNYIALLPVFMYFPSPARRQEVFAWPMGGAAVWRMLPALALMASLIWSLHVDSPAAVAIPLPALLLCSVIYDRFYVAALSFAFICWTLIAIRDGYLTIGGPIDSEMDVMAVRTGVALAALVPLFVAAAIAMNQEMSVRLRGVAEKDGTTGLSNRRAFMELSSGLYERSRHGSAYHVALLLMEIDHLKGLSERHGRTLQVQALKELGRILRPMVSGDVACGRLGNEGFAVMVVGFAREENEAFAENILAQVRGARLDGENGVAVSLSVSIGIVMTQTPLSTEGGQGFAAFMGGADQALRRVKLRGGDGFAFADDGSTLPR